jgi:hypothetical protein
VPQPFVPHFGLHPLAALLTVLSPATWARTIVFAQVVLGAIGMWLLGTHLNLRPAVRALCTLTHLLAAPTQNYVLTDFWPSHHLVWASAPWVLWMTWRILEGRVVHPWRAGLALGLVTGVVAASTNPGHLAVYVVLALAVALVHRHAMLQHAGAFAIAAAVAVSIVAPTVVQIVTERPLFPTEALSNVPDPAAFSGSLARHADALHRGSPRDSGGTRLRMAAGGAAGSGHRPRPLVADVVHLVDTGLICVCPLSVPRPGHLVRDPPRGIGGARPVDAPRWPLAGAGHRCSPGRRSNFGGAPVRGASLGY